MIMPRNLIQRTCTLMNSASVRIFYKTLRVADSLLGLASGRQWHRWEITHRISDTSEEILIAVNCEFFAMSVKATPYEVAILRKDYFTCAYEAREATLTALQNILCKIIIIKKHWYMYCIAYSYLSANFLKSFHLAKYGFRGRVASVW